ncbi:E3 ubiquitin-protein ligase DTX4 [Mytilus coruscus]|uniref:E3 ubiquitin-protein ligase DTX4 n=1 Tax=Mytilus coruscus TaxID=42192 RepID=A0A6J8BF97_MYTCO|nr:E3 ubiquitin-protein ligase DTX4 [Mytilus coruscus]
MKMSQSSTNVIVWEWMNEFGRWRPYEPNVTQYIENAYQNNSNQVNLSAADSSLSSYAIDFVTTCQIRLGTGTARPIRRSTYPPSSLPGKGIVWQWEGDVRGQWHIYDMEVGCLIEDYYSQTPRTNVFDLSKSALKLPYHIDFSKMIQIRIETGRVRKVRRATTKLAYPSGNGTNSPPQHSSVSTASTSSNGAPNSSSKSPTKSSGISPSPAKKFKSGHTNSQTTTAPNPIGAATSNNLSNFNPSAVYTGSTASQSFNHVTPNFGNTSSTQNSNQANIAYGRRLTRSLVNATSMPQNMANQMPQNMTNQNISHMGQGNGNIGQNNNTFPNFIPNITINSSSQYQSMPQMGIAGNMNNNIGNMQPSNFSMGPSNAMGPAFYGGPAMSAPYGNMFPVHHGLPGGSIVNMARSGHPAASSSMTYPSGSSNAVRSGSQHLDIPEEAKIPNIVSRQSKKQGRASTRFEEENSKSKNQRNEGLKKGPSRRDHEKRESNSKFQLWKVRNNSQEKKLSQDTVKSATNAKKPNHYQKFCKSKFSKSVHGLDEYSSCESDGENYQREHYSGDKLKVVGKCSLHLKDKNCEFFVTDTNQSPLLGFKASNELCLIHVIMTVQTDVDDPVKSFPKVFTGLGCLEKPNHIKIDSSVNPVINPPRKIPAAEKSLKVDEPTDWVSSLVVVEKPKTGKLRICLDPRNLNKAIKREHFALPTIEDITTRLTGAKYLSKLDCNNGYWQLRMDKKRANSLLRLTLHSGGVETDIDNILVWGTTQKEHDDILHSVLNRCQEVGLTLNAEKCKFRVKEVTYIGHTLSADGVRPDQEKIRAIKEMPAPTPKSGTTTTRDH